MDMYSKLVEKIALSVVGIFKTKLLNYLQEPTRNIFDLQDKISGHLIEVCNWSERIQFFGMGRAKYTDKDTVKLKLYATPRQFRSAKKTYNTYDESSFLSDCKNYLLLGDPGSGKSTTLKRLARNLLLKNETATEDIYQYPILIRLRKLDNNTNIYKYLASIFGLPYREEHDKDRDGKIIHTRTYIDSDLIEKAIPQILNSTKAILMIDGLDEVSPLSFQKKVELDLESLASKLCTSKIILTCRSGNYTRAIEGFDIFEICPLSDSQVEKIARAWLINFKDFITHLKKVPYYDLVDRPLILSQLLHYFDHYTTLPRQPSLIYRKTIKLYLEEWDQERNIKRSSMYANLDPDLKTDFLSELSYLLTYKIKKKVFSESNLITAYMEMYENFDLPKEEAGKVAREIETHTGIIVKAADEFEFSHLSTQEYLCANYIVKCSFSSNISRYISEYPPPLAISVSLSSNPSAWFAGLVLKHNNINKFSDESLSIFLDRLFIENPKFKTEINLGYAVIMILSKFYLKSSSLLNTNLLKLLNIKNIRKSISICITNYIVDENYNDSSIHHHFIPKRKYTIGEEFSLDLEYRYPGDFFLPKSLLRNIFDEYNIKMFLDKKLGQNIYRLKIDNYNIRDDKCINLSYD